MHFFLNLIVLLGAVQGAIISTLLFTSKKNSRYSNRLIAFFILSLSMACFNLYAQESTLLSESGFVRWMLNLFPFVLAMAFGPLLLLYTRSIVEPAIPFRKKDVWHFAPVVLDFVPAVIVWVFVGGVLLNLFSSQSGKGWGDFIDEWNAWSDIPRWFSVTIYSILSIKMIRSAREQGSQRDRDEYRWLATFMKFMLGFEVLWFVFLVPYIIPSIRYKFLDAVTWYPLYIPITVMVYWLGIRGYIQALTANSRKSAALAFSQEVISGTIVALSEAMEKSRLYLDAGLTVAQVSQHTKIPAKTISGVLNQHLNKSFNEYVNGFRVEEVKKRLLSDTNDHLTITGIALECGFNSQATFQRAFKAVTRVSPREYLAESKVSSPA